MSLTLQPIYRLSMIFVIDDDSGRHEAIQLSDEALDTLLVELERMKRYRAEERRPCLRIIPAHPIILHDQTEKERLGHTVSF